MTLFDPVDPGELHRQLARALDDHRSPTDRLHAAHQLHTNLTVALFPELVHQARITGASWPTVAAILNLDVDEIKATYRQAVVDQAKTHPDFDAAQAWAVVQVGE